MLGVLLFGLIVLGADAVLAARSLRATAQDLRTTATALAPALATGSFAEADDLLDDATELLDRAATLIKRPSLRVARVVPVAADDVRAAEALISAGDDLVGVGRLLVEAIPHGGDPLFANGRIDTVAFSALAEAATQATVLNSHAAAALARAPQPRTPQLADALTETRAATHLAARALPGLADLLTEIATATTGDPFEILVLLENGAELRATGGLVGFTAQLEVADGDVSLVSANTTVGVLQVRDENGDLLRVPAPADYLARYGPLAANSSLWSNINLSPHFPSVAQVAHGLYEAATDVDADLVVRSDLTGLGSVLGAFPPLSADGHPLDPSTLATEFIVDSYRLYPDEGEQTEYLNRVFREVLVQAIAQAPDTPELLAVLRESLTSRRMAAWSPRAPIQAALGAIGVAGELPDGDPGNIHVAVQNFAANKIDLFTSIDIDLSAEPTGCVMVGTAVVRITNDSPPAALDLPHNRYGTTGRWWVNVFLPAGTRLLSITADGEQAKGAHEQEQGRPVTAVLITAEPTQATELVVEWVENLDGSPYVLSSQPQPLVNSATITLEGNEPIRFDTPVGVTVDHDCRP